MASLSKLITCAGVLVIDEASSLVAVLVKLHSESEGKHGEDEYNPSKDFAISAKGCI